MSRPMKIGDFFTVNKLPGRVLVVTKREKFNYETDTAAQATVFTATVLTTANSGWRNLEDLDPAQHPMELYQGIISSEDGFDYYIKYPIGTNIHGVNKARDVGYINSERSHPLSPDDDYEYWGIYKWYPAVLAMNNTPYTDTPKVFVSGWKYLFRDANAGERTLVVGHKVPCRNIMLGGVAQEEGS